MQAVVVDIANNFRNILTREIYNGALDPMLRGYRFYIVAAAVFLITGFQPAYSNMIVSKDASKITKQSHLEVGPGKIDKSNNIPENSEFQRPCLPGRDNYRSELCAQWKAARGAADSAYWAKCQFWIALFGTLGIIISLFFTWCALKLSRESANDADQALKIANKNADAAQQQVEIARYVSDRQLRAYVSISMIEYPLLVVGQDLSGKITWRNDGITPAYDFIYELKTTITDANYPDLPEPTDQGGSRSTLNPRQANSGNFKFGRPIDQDEFDAIVVNKIAKFIVYGWGRYRDVSGNNREIRFRYELDARAHNLGVMILSSTGNEAN